MNFNVFIEKNDFTRVSEKGNKIDNNKRTENRVKDEYSEVFRFQSFVFEKMYLKE
jgi:hypothetical protein